MCESLAKLLERVVQLTRPMFRIGYAMVWRYALQASLAGWDKFGLENSAITESLEFIMLNIEIDNPELEASLQQLFGNNQQSIASAFAEFVQHRKIKQDIGVSITQLAAGEGLPLQEVMQDIRRKYE